MKNDKINMILSIIKNEGFISLVNTLCRHYSFILNRKVIPYIHQKIGYFPLKVRRMPYIVQLEPTSLCNLKCNMCLRTMKNIHGKNLSFKQMKYIIDQLEGTKEVILQGYGEPLLNPDLFKTINYLHTKGKKIVLITNGTLLTKENIYQLIKSNLTWLKISFDAVTQETYAKIRPGINVDIFKSNIASLSEIIKHKSANTRMGITFQIVVSQVNIEEIKQILPFLRMHKFRNVEIQSVLEWNNNISQIDHGRSYHDLKKYVNYLNKNKNMNINFAVDNSLKKRFKHKEICNDPWNTMFIDTGGNVIACPIGCFSNDLLMGNVFETSVRRIWNNKPYIRLRKEIRTGKVRPICKKFCY